VTPSEINPSITLKSSFTYAIVRLTSHRILVDAFPEIPHNLPPPEQSLHCLTALAFQSRVDNLPPEHAVGKLNEEL
jgi:hypothetical protein